MRTDNKLIFNIVTMRLHTAGMWRKWLCVFVVYISLCAHVKSQSRLEHNIFQTTFDTSEIQATIQKGVALMYSEPDSAVAYLQEALQISKQIGYTRGIERSLAKLGDIKINMGHYDEALSCLREALLYASQTPEGREDLPMIYNDIGRMLIYKGAYEDALNYLFIAEELAKKYPSAENQVNLGGTYNNIAMALNNLEMNSGNGDKMLYYLDLGEQIARSAQNHNLTATIIANRGLIYLLHKDWQNSLKNLNAALKIAREHNLKKVEYGLLNNLADVFISQQMPEKALSYLREALSFDGKINPYYEVATLNSLGQVYVQLKDYRQAQDILLQALEKAELYHLSGNQTTLHLMLADLYEKMENLEKAYHHHKLYTRLKDSLSNEQVKTNMYQLDLKYRTTQKDKELLEKELMIIRQKNRIQRNNIWVAGSAVSIAILSALLITLIRNYRNKQRLQAEKIRTLQQEQEISQLKAIMQGEEKERIRLARELHDGIGSQLAAIKMNFTALTKDYPVLSEIPPLQEIMNMVHNTAADVRNTAHNLMPDVLTRYGLSDALMLYCEQINKSGQLRTDLHVYGNINDLKESYTLLLYRIIQELIQNIIKHAEANHAIIQIRKEEQQLTIVVEDNGKGFDIEDTDKGIGLKQLIDRIQSVKGEILIDSAKGSGTVTYIELDCSLFEKEMTL